MPRFWLTSSVTEAPRSPYVLPTVMLAGLLPFKVMTGAVVSLPAGVEVALAPSESEETSPAEESPPVPAAAWPPPPEAPAAEAIKESNCAFVMQVSPELSETQSSFVRTRLAKKSPTPLAASAHHCVIRAKRLRINLPARESSAG